MPPVSIPGLSVGDQDTLNRLINRMDEKVVRNELRTTYYDAKYRFQDLMISTPPRLRDKIDLVLDWPAKAVDLLSQRVTIDGFVTPGSDDPGVQEIWSANNLDIEAPQGHDSALIHSCAFVWSTLGDTASGEPPVMVNVVSARNGTGIWDPRRRRLSAALQVVERSVEGGDITLMIMALPDRVVTLEKLSGGRWNVEQRRHSLGYVPVEVLPYRPNLDRPFGRSRISRTIMSLTDAALRTAVRSEVGGEFFAAPRIAALNTPKDAFENGGWDAVTSHAITIDAPDVDDIDADPQWQPSITQLAQVSMQPHVEQLRMFSTLFASAATLPLDAVGIVQDNPSSAEAIEKAEKNLALEAERTAKVFGRGWVRAMRTAWMLRNGTTDASALEGLEAVWRNPRMPSMAAASDAILKQVSTPGLEWIGGTEVALEKLGYDRPTIRRLLAEKKRADGGSLLDKLRQASSTAPVNDGNGDGTSQADRPTE